MQCEGCGHGEVELRHLAYNSAGHTNLVCEGCYSEEMWHRIRQNKYFGASFALPLWEDLSKYPGTIDHLPEVLPKRK